MENNVVEMKKEENVNNEPEKVADVQQPMEGNVEGEGTPVEGKPEPAANTKPSFKEKFVKGCKTVGNGCKTFAKAAKPYVVGAGAGIALAGITLYKVYKATHDTEGECLSKTDTPLLDYNPEADDTVDGGTVEDTGEGDTSVDVTNFDVTDVEL